MKRFEVGLGRYSAGTKPPNSYSGSEILVLVMISRSQEPASTRKKS